VIKGNYFVLSDYVLTIWHEVHSRTQSPSYARSTERDKGLWPNPYQTGIWFATTKVVVLIPDIFYYHVLWYPVMDLARAPRRTARKKGSGYENGTKWRNQLEHLTGLNDSKFQIVFQVSYTGLNLKSIASFCEWFLHIYRSYLLMFIDLNAWILSICINSVEFSNIFDMV
jgi:hypothetical protein